MNMTHIQDNMLMLILIVQAVEAALAFLIRIYKYPTFISGKQPSCLVL